jgi:hypothetical protein
MKRLLRKHCTIGTRSGNRHKGATRQDLTRVMRAGGAEHEIWSIKSSALTSEEETESIKTLNE